METKVFTQYGYPVIIGSFVGVIAMIVAILFNNTVPKEGIIPIAVVIVSLVITILMSYKMTICVDDQYLWFRMGVGFFGKTFELADIEDCQIVKIHSSGIRKIRHGNMYSISGFKAVEIRFKGTNKIIRLGTNRPEELCDAINNAISKHKTKKEVFY